MPGQRVSPAGRYVYPVQNMQSFSPNDYLASTAPAMARGDTNDSRASYISIIPESRPGHFPDLNSFAHCDRPNVDLQTIDTEEAMNADLGPGHIIRIQDFTDESRLHNRLMLVLRTNRSGSSMSMTCLSFCRHQRRQNSPEFAQEHAQVVDGRISAPPQASQNSTPPLRVVISTDQKPDASFRLQSHIWINVREVWNVDFGVRVAVLGDAEPQSFGMLLHRVKQIFINTLGDADRQTPASPRGSHRALAGTIIRPAGDRQERRRSFTQFQRSGLSGLIRQQVTIVETPMERSRSHQ